jgi:predicted negative regulator of RcsB-dependent stress response
MLIAEPERFTVPLRGPDFSRPVTMSEFEEGGLDSLAGWFKTNQKLVSIVLGGLAVVAIGVVVWQKSADTKIENAERAFFAAQTATAANPANANAELAKVATRYSGTSAGDRAALLSAQALMTQGKTAEAMKQLTALESNGGNDRLGATLQTLLAAGYENLNEPAAAAKAYLAAASTSFGMAKIQRQADAARAYMAAGNTNEALKLWTELAKDEKSPLAAEAHVRLGELAVKQ